MKQNIYYELGFSAALANKNIDDCQLRKGNRKNQWVRGYQCAQDKMIDKRLSDDKRQTGLQHIKLLRSKLT